MLARREWWFQSGSWHGSWSWHRRLCPTSSYLCQMYIESCRSVHVLSYFIICYFFHDISSPPLFCQCLHQKRKVSVISWHSLYNFNDQWSAVLGFLVINGGKLGNWFLHWWSWCIVLRLVGGSNAMQANTEWVHSQWMSTLAVNECIHCRFAPPERVSE